MRFLSPEIDESFTDGDGHEWRDVITHVALTPRPVFHRQKPFGTPPRLSHGRNVVWLSLDQRVQPGGSDMGNDDDFEDDDTGADEGGQPDAQTLIDELIPILDEKFKLHLPGHVTPDTFIRDLLMACHGHPGWSDDGLGQGDDDQGGDEGEGDELGLGDSGPRRRASMSLLGFPRRMRNRSRTAADVAVARRERRSRLQLSRPRPARPPHPRAIGAERGRQVAEEVLRNCGQIAR